MIFLIIPQICLEQFYILIIRINIIFNIFLFQKIIFLIIFLNKIIAKEVQFI
jgi:hypothetical protein